VLIGWGLAPVGCGNSVGRGAEGDAVASAARVCWRLPLLVSSECLDRLLIFSHRELVHVLRVYIRHNNRRRHRALDLRPPDTTCARSSVQVDSNLHDCRVRRRDLLGGLIHEYELAAAS
jgi:hypothetical protein